MTVRRATKAGREVAEGLPRPRSVQIMRIAFLTATLVFVLFPLVWLALGSFKTRHDALSLPPRIIFDPTFEAYAKIVAGGFIRAFGNSLTIALTNVALALVIGTPAAFALTRMRGRIRDNLSFWILSIRMAPLFAVILPLYVLFKSVGLLDTRFAVALAHLTLTLPLAIWMLMTYFRSLPVELDQAAMLDGASPLADPPLHHRPDQPADACFGRDHRLHLLMERVPARLRPHRARRADRAGRGRRPRRHHDLRLAADRRDLGLLDDPGFRLRRLRPAPHRDRARLGCGEMRRSAAMISAWLEAGKARLPEIRDFAAALSRSRSSRSARPSSTVRTCRSTPTR